MTAHVVDDTPDTWFCLAVDDVLEATKECAERVVAADTEGRCVSVDLYALGLKAATKHNVNPVRMWTAVIDIAWGMRDYLRGPKPAPPPPPPWTCSPWLAGSVVE